MPKKVLVLIAALDVGGVEMDLLRNLPRISKKVASVAVYPFVYPGTLAPEFVNSGVEVIGYSSGRRLFPEKIDAHRSWKTLLKNVFGERAYRLFGDVFLTTKYILRTARIIRRDAVDVVHCVLPNAYFVGVLAALLAGCRYRVMSRVSSNFYMEKHRLLGWLEKWLLHRFVTVAIGNSSAILDELRQEGIAETKLYLLYNGIDTSAFSKARLSRKWARHAFNIADSTLLITVVGNLHVYKGHRELLLSLAKVREITPSGWKVMIAGRDESGNLAKLRTLCSELGLEPQVHFLGQYSEIPKLLAAGDIHVHPSHHEGLPNSVIEAMASGLPVIASAVGGIPELIEDNVCGRLVPPKDIGALAVAIVELITNSSKREAFGKAAEACVMRRFSIDTSVAGYEYVYQSIDSCR